MADGMLPPGLQLDSQGLLSGTLAATGAFLSTLSVVGSDSQTAAAELILTIEPDGDPQRLVLPQIASGGSWKTHLHLLNPSPSEASVRIVFRSDAGEPLTVPLTLDSLGRSEELSAAEISETIPPWSSLHVRTPGEHAAALVGWAEILHPGPVTSYATVEHFKSPGIPTDLLPALAPSLLLPFNNANGSQVGVALMNGNASAPAAINLTIWDSDWVHIGSVASSNSARPRTAGSAASDFSLTRAGASSRFPG